MIIVGGAAIFVEMDFTGTLFGAAPTWTDVTADCITSPQTPGSSSITGSWGRQDWLGDVTAGSLSLTLINTSGKYTPGNTTSPYYPNVKYGVRCQVRMVISGVTVYVAGGFATDWTATPANGTYWTSTVNFTDIYGLFSNSTELRGYLTEECTLDNPVYLYTLQEDEGSTSFGDITTQQTPLAVTNSKYGAGVVDAGQAPTGMFVAGNVVDVTNTTYGTATKGGSWLQASVTPILSPWTFEAWVQMPSTAPATIPAAIWADQLTLFLQVFTTGQVGLPGSSTAISPGSLCDGNVHQVVLSYGATGTITLYIDGVSVGTDGGFSSFSTSTLLSLGMWTFTPPGVSPFTGGFAFVSLYPTVLSTSRILAHYNAGASAFQGERTDLHVARLLSYRTNYGSVLDTGLGFVGSEDITGETMQTALSDTSAAEGGTLYANGLQQIVFRSRAVTFNPAATVTVDVSQGQMDVPTTFRDDVQNVVNDITVSRPNGSDQRAFNAASIAQVGDYTQSITANVDTDAHAFAIASWLVAEGTQDQTASPTLTFDLYALLSRGSTALVLSLLQLRPLDVVKTTNNLPQAPSSTMQMVVQGGSFTISSEAISLELYTTPLPPSVVQINGDAAHGINGSAILAY